MSNRYLLALGYGGERQAAAWFEWNFRCLIGEENKNDTAARDAFIRDFTAATENGQEYVIPAEDPSAPFVRLFGEYGKEALAEHRDLFLFYILEDAVTEKQYRIYVKPDAPDEEMMPNQLLVDGFEVPRDGLLWMQEQAGCRIFVTEDRTEMMLEFPYRGPEELPVL